MRVYFTAAIYHRERLRREYQAIIDGIRNLGHEYIEAYDVMNNPLSVALDPDGNREHSIEWKKKITRCEIAVVPDLRTFVKY